MAFPIWKEEIVFSFSLNADNIEYMKKSVRLFSSMALVGALGLVTGCNSASSGSYSSTPFTVNFFDDSATPVQIGYAYTRPGHPAEFRNMDGSTYDYLSNSGTAPNKVGEYLKFKEWKGTYGSDVSIPETYRGQSVDTTKIYADCDLYATFDKSVYSWNITFKSEGSSIKEDGASFPGSISFGSAVRAPSSDPAVSLERYGYDEPFLGYKFSGDTAADPQVLRKDASGNLPLTYSYGIGAPTGTATLGSFYLDSTLDADYLPTDQVYYGNGNDWIKLTYNSHNATLASSLRYSFVAVYAKNAKSFPVTISDGGVVKHTFNVAYQDELSFAAVYNEDSSTPAKLSTSILITYTPSDLTKVPETYTFSKDGAYSLEGAYGSDADELYAGKTVFISDGKCAVMGPIAFTPTLSSGVGSFATTYEGVSYSLAVKDDGTLSFGVGSLTPIGGTWTGKIRGAMSFAAGDYTGIGTYNPVTDTIEWVAIYTDPANGNQTQFILSFARA